MDQNQPLSVFDRLMLVLGGQQPQGRPQIGFDQHLMRVEGMPAQQSNADAFRQLQMQEHGQPPKPQPGMIERALGSLFGG